VNINDIKKLIGYPQIARDASIQGMVVVRVLVDKNGNYAKHKVTNEVHPILSRAVEEHVNKLKFTPAIQGGKPIKFWVNIPFNFMLIK
ncbi:MAG: energy transducer TonB, partial [Bacteroidetes bacterium]|nr:energy transducer TonB [Bacteroidota bacterium]